MSNTHESSDYEVDLADDLSVSEDFAGPEQVARILATWFEMDGDPGQWGHTIARVAHERNSDLVMVHTVSGQSFAITVKQLTPPKHKYLVEVAQTIRTTVEVDAPNPVAARQQVERRDFPLPAREQWSGDKDWDFTVMDADGNELVSADGWEPEDDSPH